jgi:membrane-bound lytic murein transglycosylase F
VGGLLLLAAALGCREIESRTGDLQEIEVTGVLRVAVRPGFADPQGAVEVTQEESALIRQLASRLHLEVSWIEAPRHDRLLPMVASGEADLAISRFSPVSLLDTGLRGTTAIEWVDDLLIAGPSAAVGDPSVHVHRSARTSAVMKFLTERNLVAVDVPEEVPIEEVLERVRSGRYSRTIVDSRILQAVAQGRLGKVATVATRRPVVWAVRDGNPRLRLAADRFLFAERVLSRAARNADCRDLSRIRRDGVLRLVTRNSATTCTIEHGGLVGFEYELALEFSKRIGVRLELAIPPRDTDPLEYLRQGYGDFAALHEPAALEDLGSILVSDGYRRVDLVAVVSSRAAALGSVEELAGVRAAASRPVASMVRMIPLVAPVRARPPRPGGDAFTSMLAVARGEAPVAIVDRDAARLEIADRSDLQLGPVVLPDTELVWLFNTSSPRLLREANRYLREARLAGFVKQLVFNQFGTWPQRRRAEVLPIPDGALSPYDALLQWADRTYDIDWRLLGSLMYEESRFDTNAVGPGGSAGLFQFMPPTWRELGVEDPHDPQESVEAAARYLRQLMDGFGELPLPDRVAMAIASYNVGPGHVQDARRLAREMGLDPGRWKNSVETAMLILDDPDVAIRFSAGVCRCRRGVGYTRRILRRYAAYTEQFPPA